jgi:RNA polymerase sigma-70 factor, ECF subfamily
MMLNFETIYEQFRGPLKAFIAKRISNQANAEDMVHDVFVKIHDRIDTLQEPDKLTPWIYQIARNSIIDSYRKNHQLVNSDDLLEIEQHESIDGPDDLSRMVQSMVEKLPSQDKEALLMSDFQGMKQAEIAQRLGISLSGAKSRVQRARKKLKELLLECCHFEFDRYGTVFAYHPRKCTKCCETDTCK